MGIVIEEVISEVTPSDSPAAERPGSDTEPAGQDNKQHKLVQMLQRYERRQQRLGAD